jgi:hypothetical protein
MAPEKEKLAWLTPIESGTQVFKELFVTHRCAFFSRTPLTTPKPLPHR